MRVASLSMAQRTYGGATIGVDTHGDIHVAAAFTSDLGRPLGHLEIETTPAGYRRLLTWARRLADDLQFGLEGTGSYGAGLARFLRDAGHTVLEVNRPNRQARHARGKSDPVDAEAAARAVLSGEATAVAKRDDDRVGMIRSLRVARRSAVKATTQITNQIKALIVTAPWNCASSCAPSPAIIRSPLLLRCDPDPSQRRQLRPSWLSKGWRSATTF